MLLPYPRSLESISRDVLAPYLYWISVTLWHYHPSPVGVFSAPSGSAIPEAIWRGPSHIVKIISCVLNMRRSFCTLRVPKLHHSLLLDLQVSISWPQDFYILLPWFTCIHSQPCTAISNLKDVRGMPPPGATHWRLFFPLLGSSKLWAKPNSFDPARSHSTQINRLKDLWREDANTW